MLWGLTLNLALLAHLLEVKCIWIERKFVIEKIDLDFASLCDLHGMANDTKASYVGACMKMRIALTASRFFTGSREAVNKKDDQPKDKKEMILS